VAVPDIRERWRTSFIEASTYDWAVAHERVAGVLGRLLWGTDTSAFYRDIARLSELPTGIKVLDTPCGGGVAFRGLRPLERLCIRARRSLGDDTDVKFHRGGVGANLNDPDLGPVVVHVFVERQELRLFSSMNEPRSAARSRSAASWPSLSLFVAMKMNGAGITGTLSVSRCRRIDGSQLARYSGGDHGDVRAAAVDVDDGAVDEGGFVARQVDGGARDRVGCAGVTGGRAVHHRLGAMLVGAVGAVERGVADDARGDRVDAHAGGPELGRPCLRECLDRPLRGAVQRDARNAPSG
jgi:hypothetical protein